MDLCFLIFSFIPVQLYFIITGCFAEYEKTMDGTGCHCVGKKMEFCLSSGESESLWKRDGSFLCMLCEK